MPALAAASSFLLLVDLQARLMPAIADGAAVLANARRLRDAARLLGVPLLATEQNPRGLGATDPSLAPGPDATVSKMSFDATPHVIGRLPPDLTLVVAGCEAHVCVLQTVLGLLGVGRRVAVAADAVGSRRPENRDAGLRRMERHGAEIVTTEMALFEWLGTADHPRFREVLPLIR